MSRAARHWAARPLAPLVALPRPRPPSWRHRGFASTAEPQPSTKPASIFDTALAALARSKTAAAPVYAPAAAALTTMKPQRDQPPGIYSFKTGFFRMSPRKLNLVGLTLRRLTVQEALEQMQFSKRRASWRILALLTRALANLKHNYGAPADPRQWVISEASVGRGLIHKRIRLHARGRFGIELRRTSSLRITLRHSEHARDPAARLAAVAARETHPTLQRLAQGRPMRDVLLKALAQRRPRLPRDRQRLGRVRPPWNSHQFRYVTSKRWTSGTPEAL